MRSTILSIVLALSNKALAAENSVSSILSGYRITNVSGARATTLANVLNSAQFSIYTRAQYSSAISVIASQADAEVFKSLVNSGIPHLTTTAPPVWFTSLPDAVQNELWNDQNAMKSVVESAYASATSSNAGPKATAGVVAGVLGVVGVGLVAVV